jgi:hypothetical protein
MSQEETDFIPLLPLGSFFCSNCFVKIFVLCLNFSLEFQTINCKCQLFFKVKIEFVFSIWISIKFQTYILTVFFLGLYFKFLKFRNWALKHFYSAVVGSMVKYLTYRISWKPNLIYVRGSSARWDDVCAVDFIVNLTVTH